MRNKNKIIVVGAVIIAVLFALSFLVDKSFLYPALIGAMILMHLGMHGMHSQHEKKG